jgi:hypothetical protein
MNRILKSAVALILAASVSFAAVAQTVYYEPAQVTLGGTMITAKGQTPDGKTLDFPALALPASLPISVESEPGSCEEACEEPESGVTLLHMVLSQDTMNQFKSLKGKPVMVRGTLFHSDNGNHQTDVLITPTAIIPIK